MPTYYCTDANITDRLSGDLTSSDIATADNRTDKLRAPATALVDAYLPEQAPFANITDGTPTPSVIQEACIAFCLWLANQILKNNSTDPQAVMYFELAEKILQVRDGKAMLVLSGNYVAIGTPDIKRDRDDEDIDEIGTVM